MCVCLLHTEEEVKGFSPRRGLRYFFLIARRQRIPVTQGTSPCSVFFIYTFLSLAGTSFLVRHFLVRATKERRPESDRKAGGSPPRVLKRRATKIKLDQHAPITMVCSQLQSGLSPLSWSLLLTASQVQALSSLPRICVIFRASFNVGKITTSGIH